MEIKLKPEALNSKEINKFRDSKRFLFNDQSINNEILLSISSFEALKQLEHDRLLYFATHDPLDQHNRKFIHDIYPIFTSLQRILNLQQSNLSTYARISDLYKNTLEQHLSSCTADNLLHWANVYAIWSFTQLLYFPFDGRGEGVIAEELLDWINRVDVAPTSEEGLEITSANTPHEHDNFWPYIYKCIIRGFHKTATQPLHSLLSHQTKSISNTAERLISLLYTFPRSTNYQFEHDYFSAHKAWRDEAKRTLSSIADLSQYADEFTKDVFDDITLALQLLCGKKSKIFEVADDWRECLAAYGLFVIPSLRRDDIPSVLEEIFKEVPLDTTLPDQCIEAALANAETTKAITLCNEFDPWLVAHLTDLLDKIGAVDHDPEFPLTLRQHFLLQYADKLASDPGLWTITLDYYAQCGVEGASRVRALIVRVPLLLDVKGDNDEKMDGDDVFNETIQTNLPNLTRVEEILSICQEYALEEEASEVCRNAAEQLVEREYYGLAVAFCIRAKEARKLGRITDLILEEYLNKGEKVFSSLVDSIPTSLLNVTTYSAGDMFDDGHSNLEIERDGTQDASARALARDPAVSSRLAFLARYKDFHSSLKKDDKEGAAILLVEMLTTEIAPKRFWSVLLADALPLLEDSEVLFTLEDAYELLRFLEDVHTGPNLKSLPTIEL
ncbi:Nucleoporin, Nup85-like protein [Wallemia mellicola]|uniref:Nuclear pore complex protein Nup85 n=1 Tax=Wallemia mellicola TaxID=1708541 RepID=A0AB74KM26_9BASI|nr:Nucleoporin, Nup85-like protein [Wallemia mellicola]TIB91153.1 Nucleoporin, Nup85-like protein [Wallemia mellicola]TIC26445.1 Nucleoporin, Nup85-like protein [Wallemia mellicola]TIC35784.1 Nucleoporin, Nup85-like protein [Wallemia mellicola]TIC40638.1 Nucleoporin, Nup85-like protein [Wallemia mellicola]